jgi:hypothetical protein
MKAVRLTDDRPALCYHQPTYITLGRFATALADHCYSDNPNPIPKTKKEAEEILRVQIRFYGYQGVYPDGHFENGGDEGYHEVYQECKEWVMRKYPHLVNSENIEGAG